MTTETNDIRLVDMDEWHAFAEANHDGLLDGYDTIENALHHARDGGLTLGGGAAPLFFVTFRDE